MDVQHENLQHAMRTDCEDLDCELHHPWAGYEETVLGKHELAFFMAGAVWMWKNYDCIHPTAPMTRLKLMVKEVLDGEGTTTAQG